MTKTFSDYYADNVRDQLDAYKKAMEIYRLCVGTYRASKLEVTGIITFKSYDLKFPYQYSDHTDPVARYSDKYTKDVPSTSNNLQMHRLRIESQLEQGTARNYLQRKTFIDTQRNYAWRASSHRQQELAEESDRNITNSVTIERLSEENIVEQASIIVGEYPYKPELEQDVIDWLNVINHRGK